MALLVRVLIGSRFPRHGNRVKVAARGFTQARKRKIIRTYIRAMAVRTSGRIFSLSYTGSGSEHSALLPICTVATAVTLVCKYWGGIVGYNSNPLNDKRKL
jgi:hypothetical protein